MKKWNPPKASNFVNYRKRQTQRKKLLQNRYSHQQYAHLKIGPKTTEISIRTCESCGEEIDTMELAEFIKTVLE